MRKFAFIILIILSNASIATAQSDYRNLEKYWWYRYRLVNDFMKIGPECGESIPANRRWITHITDQGIKDTGLHWGDATEHLGNYINFLSSEYRMLRNNGMSTDRTTYELYYALNALHRLDIHAEAYSNDIDGSYPCNWQRYGGGTNTGSDNGFFIRDDVPQFDDPALGYVSLVRKNYQHFNRPGIIGSLPANTVVASDYCQAMTEPHFAGHNPVNWPHPTPRVPVEESKDQICQLYGGLGMVTRLVDNWVTYNGENITKKAGQKLFKIIDYIPNSNPNFPLSLYKWDIFNPTYNARVLQGFGFNFLSKGAVEGLHQNAQNNGVSSGQINSLWMKTFIPGYESAWQLSQYAPSFLVSDAVYMDTYACFSDSWKTGVTVLGYTIGFQNSTWHHILAHAHGNMTGGIYAGGWYFPHTPLMYRIVSGPGPGHGIGFNSSNYNETFTYSEMLDKAPFCGCHNYKANGPFGNTTQDYGDKFWSNHNILTDQWNKQNTFDDADYNNVDYMVIFNLYNLCDPKYMKSYFNSYWQDNYSTSFPLSNGWGSSSNKLQLNYLEYLGMTSKIASNANITFRGAKVIDLEPGFSTQTGSVFTAYVQDYNCNRESYYYAIGKTPFTNTPNKGTSEDSTYTLDFPPDGVRYYVEPGYNPNWNEADTALTFSEDQEQTYKDSLLNDVIATGDTTLIRYALSYYNASSPVNKQKKASDLISRSLASIYPNPSAGTFAVNTPSDAEYTISVLNQYGQTLYTDQKLKGPHAEISLPASIPPGTYMIKVENQTMHTEIKLIIIR